MSVATLDTHEVVQDLVAAGFAAEQARAIARNLRKAQDLDVSAFATKSDLGRLRSDIKLAFWKWMLVGAYGLQTLLIVGAMILVAKP